MLDQQTFPGMCRNNTASHTHGSTWLNTHTHTHTHTQAVATQLCSLQTCTKDTWMPCVNACTHACTLHVLENPYLTCTPTHMSAPPVKRGSVAGVLGAKEPIPGPGLGTIVACLSWGNWALSGRKQCCTGGSDSEVSYTTPFCLSALPRRGRRRKAYKCGSRKDCYIYGSFHISCHLSRPVKAETP